MLIKKSSFVFRLISVSMLLTFLFSAPGTLPARAAPPASTLAMSGDFLWAKGMGGTLDDQGNSIAVDSNGNVYTTGFFTGTANFGATILTSAGGSDIFVTKTDSSGNFLWVKRMGGASGDDVGRGIAVDSNGNVYTTGHFYISADFNPDPVIVSDLTSTGSYDIFISKLDSNGNFVWSKNMGSISDDSGVGIAVDSNGNVYTTGAFTCQGLFNPAYFGGFSLWSRGSGVEDIFVSKVNVNGNVVWAKQMGGDGIDYGLGIAIDSIGNVYTTGGFVGAAYFDPNNNIKNLTSAGLRDIFVSKLNTNGNFIWAKSMGGTGSDFGYGIALDSSGSNVYITGDYEGAANFGATHLTSAGGFDSFVAKYDSSGNLCWLLGSSARV